MLRPHEELPKEIASDRSFTKIFLAGTIDMGNKADVLCIHISWKNVKFP